MITLSRFLVVAYIDWFARLVLELMPLLLFSRTATVNNFDTWRHLKFTFPLILKEIHVLIYKKLG